MKSRFGRYLFLPLLALALAALIACSQDPDETPAPPLFIAESPAESPRPLTDGEREAIGEFEGQLQTIDAEWDEFYQDFDDWRASLTACHPNLAHEALRDLAASYVAVTERARNLPRASSSKELADLVIAAADAEEAALRQLRDRWQAGNVSLFETVEQRRVEAGGAQNAVADMSLALREEFEEGPTADEVELMEEFSETFDIIEDAWDDFHGVYVAFARRQGNLEDDERAAGYEQLVEQFKGIVATIGELTPVDINKDLIDELQDAAEVELAALEFLAESPSSKSTTSEDEDEDVDASVPAAAPTSAPAPAGTPVPIGTPTPGPTEPGPADPTKLAPASPVPTEEPSTAMSETQEEELSPKEIFAAIVEESEAVLEAVAQEIEEIVDDKSAENLADLQRFDVQLQRFVAEWEQFYEDFIEWRASDGGCNRVEVGQELTQFSQRAEGLAREVRNLPRSGFLPPVYTLVVEAGERESGAIRTLANSWTPFAVDVFKAVDEERVNAGRLRRQASIALQELRNRP
jgi:hypothetical protein